MINVCTQRKEKEREIDREIARKTEEETQNTRETERKSEEKGRREGRRERTCRILILVDEQAWFTNTSEAKVSVKW